MGEAEEQKEYIKFQYIMNYKAYRRKMIATRVSIAVILSAALFCFAIVKVWLGILCGMIPLFGGAFAVIVGLPHEETYIIFNTRFVIRKKGKRASVPLENIKAVKYKRAFYEKKLATGTVTITALNEKGRKRKYKLRHVFDAKEGVKFLSDASRSLRMTQ
ncbi:MAG: hypothetical protein J1G38_01240 [Clostridiales bacterium]|nr:hypothetical protein [Clostridiales bacterium]